MFPWILKVDKATKREMKTGGMRLVGELENNGDFYGFGGTHKKPKLGGAKESRAGQMPGPLKGNWNWKPNLQLQQSDICNI